MREIPFPQAGSGGAHPAVFACGADMKNRFSFLEGGRLHLSEDHGDLADAENFARYLASVKETADRLGIRPRIVAHDLHPGYYSTRAAGLFPGARRLGVQHHHAHVAAAMAGAGEEGPVIGVSFDGTGYGTDGNLWGGEFLVVSTDRWRRRGHLAYMRMPGGEAAVREPRRMAFSLLRDAAGDRALGMDLPFLRSAPRDAFEVMARMMESGMNAPLTSSCGRLFDAVSSLLGITHIARREAEAAVRLEEVAAVSSDEGCYPFEIGEKGGEYVADHRRMIVSLAEDLAAGVPVGDLARRFHNSLARLVADMAGRIGGETGIAKVALSGGVFQNGLLSRMVRDTLRERGCEPLECADVPVSDLGICVGQTWAAVHGARPG